MGPEKPLVEGLVDYLEQYKINVFGPNKIASQLGDQNFYKTTLSNIISQQPNLEYLKII